MVLLGNKACMYPNKQFIYTTDLDYVAFAYALVYAAGKKNKFKTLIVCFLMQILSTMNINIKFTRKK